MLKSVARTTVLLAVLLAGCAGAPPAVAHDVERQRHCLALALYWEARGEGARGMEAVGWTVMNRVYSPLFPATPCEVVYEGGEKPGCQFSWYCDGRSDRPRDWHSWQHAMLIAGKLLDRPRHDPTGGALFYHADSIAKPWRRPRTFTARIGRHLFYR